MGYKNWEFRNYKGQDGEEKRELYITGEISEAGWYDDDTTPNGFERELYQTDGDVDMYVCSPGGDVFAADEIYHSISQYKGGKITAYPYGLCASAASYLIMAANKIYISPTGKLMIHNPQAYAVGDSTDMKRTSEQLDAVKESIINAYELKTKLSREKLAEYMNQEKMFDATEAIELGFADGLIESEQDKFSAVDVTNSAMVRFYNSVKDWKLAFQPKAERTKQEENTMSKENKALEAVDNTSADIKVEDKQAVAAVVDVKDFEAVVNEFKVYKEQSKKEIEELREYKARQEAEIKAQDLVGLPGITDERRIELARMADEKLFGELKAMATAMNELVKPVGAVVKDEDVEEGKEENLLLKKVKDYAAENGVSESEAYYAVVNGGK